MYAGTTLTRYSGRIFGAHQKIDKIARRHLSNVLPPGITFPDIRQILHFEGRNGPDGIKRKSPARSEPWHFFNPFDHDGDLEASVREHYDKLVRELRRGNQERAAFEAAWLAHAIVDGLTPAHHYPYEQILTELRGGRDKTSRTSLRRKVIMPGDTKRQLLINNWRMWGPRGLLVAHGLFEFGVSAIIIPLRLGDTAPTPAQCRSARKLGINKLFLRAAREIAVRDMFERYHRNGWTPKLAWEVRHRLAPTIVQTVTLAWLLAAEAATENTK